jgi:hypothetical protein
VVPTKIVFSPFDNSEYSIDDGPWLRVPPEGVVELPLSAAAKLSARNPRAQTTTQTIQPGPDQTVVMPFNPGHVIPTCKLPVQVTVNNKLIDLGKPFTVTFGVRLDSSVPVTIQFTGTGVDESPINKTVEAGKDITVECVLR